MKYLETVEKVSNLLTDDTEWVNRFKGYATYIKLNEQNHIIGRRRFKIPKPFYLYSSIVKLKNKCTLYYDLRFLGQSVATLKVDKEIVTISTEKKETKNKQWFNIDIPLNNVLWKGNKASKFRKGFKDCTETRGKSPEHAVESALLSEFKQEKKQLKSLYNIQPVLLANSFFQMPTPLSASAKKIKYANSSGGGIDILARVKHEGNKVRLCVMELKDENTNTEPAEKVMNQAIAYATFIAHLLRSESGNTWYNIFGFSGNVPERLIIDTSIVMPFPTNGKIEHINKEKIEVLNNTYIELYDLYFEDNTSTNEGDNYKFIGTLKDEMMK